ncbi:MAG: YebC/PmpR family DNA-binding transcriptional regulator [Mycoplasmataceae bacterium]|nr:YebC/PmpR family DNA-binding transcriptional regulator [Mycoplasmataceae bacterium]MBR2849270.1 YebC/PmpR family DNA-binding transcriptional regulator [Mycoplasmataceae bacterium]MBR2998957.1 YebC/PmpR family DNA-binding transcriptional regulator [Mycoplasmataceae bacterium]MBR3348117.1 YebC/PmpR family DNA-binding transcriptional regulator [Mycoplasmataceae bacterium]MBR3571137.1 YebC/PmpR family DNA-binding transcriptional regulator [Mycoplasmataceae bacterium]
MAGHSKWANIKHRKGAQDAARAKLFAKLSKEIMVAAAKGGPDLSSNANLRLAVSKAKAKSMPKSNIENAIAKGSGSSKSSGDSFKEIIFSGNLRHGIILLVICLSDNYNRVSSDIQFLFKKANGTIGKTGSIPFNFERKGVLELQFKKENQEDLEMIIMDSGADDYEIIDDYINIYVNPSNFDSVKSKLEEAGYSNFETAEITFVSSDKVKLEKEDMDQFLATLERFEDNDDVQEVYHNVDLSTLE